MARSLSIELMRGGWRLSPNWVCSLSLSLSLSPCCPPNEQSRFIGSSSKYRWATLTHRIERNYHHHHHHHHNQNFVLMISIRMGESGGKYMVRWLKIHMFHIVPDECNQVFLCWCAHCTNTNTHARESTFTFVLNNFHNRHSKWFKTLIGWIDLYSYSIGEATAISKLNRGYICLVDLIILIWKEITATTITTTTISIIYYYLSTIKQQQTIIWKAFIAMSLYSQIKLCQVEL